MHRNVAQEWGSEAFTFDKNYRGHSGLLWCS
jgi:hypothetical protein